VSLDFQRLEQVLAEAAARADPGERVAYLDVACGEDRELRGEVERLLAANEKAGDFLECGVGSAECGVWNAEGDLGMQKAEGRMQNADTDLVEKAGSVIGRYKLLEEIGEGGFGVVYMAEQTEPVQRKVALKVIKAGMDTREVVARFEAERQALALMDHPSIARVFDGGIIGASDSQPSTLNSQLPLGRPYFVMELVRGIPITEFCDQRKLSTVERLKLFMQVCHAVQHAHQKGIIHRDLKPTNILVTLVDGEPVPKVIDFGVAKALGQKLTDKTLFTGFLKMVGTPAYMSPEQADLSGVDIDTRADIYALGVLLYELLTGVTPFDGETLHQAALDEIRRMIRETEPPKPSTRLQTLVAADVRRLTSKSEDRRPKSEADRASLRLLLQERKELINLVRGDLDWIVMKCLEKDRGRRYETANALARDIEHHLKQEPVAAVAPSALYRAGKFVLRHRFGVATAAALTLALALGLAAALVGFGQAMHARDHAERIAKEEARQRQMAEANYQTAREAVDQMLTRLAADLTDQPRMSRVRRRLLEDALRFYQGFLQQKGNDPELRHAVAQTYMRVGNLYLSLGQWDKSLESWGNALRLLQALAQRNPDAAQYREEMASAHGALSYANRWHDRPAETVAHSRKVVALYEQLQREFPAAPEYLSRSARAHVDLGNALGVWGAPRKHLEESDQALRLYGELRTRFPDLPEDLGLLSHIRHWRGNALEDMGRFEEAEQQYRQTHELRTGLVAEQPGSADLRGSLAHIKTYLGDLLAQTGRPKEGEKLIREAIAIREKDLEDEPDSADWPRLGYDYHDLSRALLGMGRAPEAEAARRHCVELHMRMARNLPNEPINRKTAADSLTALSSLLQATGKSEEAMTGFRDAINAYEKLIGEYPDSPQSYRRLGSLLADCPMAQLRDPPRAVTLAEHAVQLAPEWPACWELLGIARYRAGDRTAAIGALKKTAELLEGGDVQQWLFLAMACCQAGERGQARLWYDKAIARIETYPPVDVTTDRLRAEAEELLGKDHVK
jgi:eukaryotic-like serine/threonine-protein kinase